MSKPAYESVSPIRSRIESEIRRRAEFYLAQKHLIVDYYRIRRRIAYPLPVARLHIPAITVPGINPYPWGTWLALNLEERINSLGWAVEWFGDRKAQLTCREDLAALTEWPCYRQLPFPDLCLGHTARTLWTAYSRWNWLDRRMRKIIEKAFTRMVEDAIPLSDQRYGAYSSVDSVLRAENPNKLVHNIHLVGTAGLTLAAKAIDSPEAESLNRRMHILFNAMLELRQAGHSEGTCYDGYLMDFAIPWLQTLPEMERMPILNHPRFDDFLNESTNLSVPGDAAQTAELSDMEPKDWPFHLSSPARLLNLKNDPRAAWFLRRCRLDWMRADALESICRAADNLTESEPESGALDANYAVVLRSGWKADNLAVAMSASNSPMGHIHFDNGSLVIGHQGRWVVTDPGYQQFMNTQEREFTIGSHAHNAPVINGMAQSKKLIKRDPILRDHGNGLLQTEVDITCCYPSQLNLASVVRTIWLQGKKIVVVADRIRNGTYQSIEYFWHGNPEAAWLVEEGSATIILPAAELRIASPQLKLTESNVIRLRGSRGQLTLAVKVELMDPVIWWVFWTGSQSRNISLEEGSEAISVDDYYFKID